MNGSSKNAHRLSPYGRKLLLCGLFISAFMISSAQPSQAEIQWRDIPADFWAKSAIQSLSELGIFTENKEQRFYPYRPVTRAEFASILAKSLPQRPAISASVHFSDIPNHHWAAQDIQTVVSQGWMSGVTPEQFRPNQILTQGELYASLGQTQQTPLEASQVDALLAPYRDQNLLPSWARTPVAQAISSGFTLSERSKTRLSPDIPATRASVAACVAKVMKTPIIKPHAGAHINSLTNATPPSNDSHPPEARVSHTQASSNLLESSMPAANVVGQLTEGDQPGSWQLVRADGKRFRLDTQALSHTDRAGWKVGLPVRVTGNLDAVRGTAENPILVVQTCWPLDTLTPTEHHATTPETRPQATQTPQAEKTAPQKNPAVTTTASAPSISTAQNAELPPVLSAQSEAEHHNLETPGQEAPQPNLAQPAATASIPQSGDALGHAFSRDPQTVKAIPEATSPTSPETPKTAPELKLYFPNLANLVSDPSLMLGEAVAREGLGPVNPRQAIATILAGPIESEKRAGYFMDSDLKRLRLDKFSVNETGLANVQLYAPGDFQFSNSSVPARLDEQIRRTLKQFDGIQRVKVSVKNPKDKILWISP